MRRMIVFSSVAALLAVSGWWLWNSSSQLRDAVGQYIENGELLTFETRYTSQQIMEEHRQELIGNSQRSFQNPCIKYHPYALIEAKYTLADKKTREDVLIWGLLDGEIVLNTETWEKTHGFEDAINANASATDFKIMYALAKNRGTTSRDQLQKDLLVEADILDPWIESARAKHLVALRGNEVQLHFQDPKILIEPQTKMKQWLVTRPYSHAEIISKKYSQSQIEKIARAAFGNDYTIREIKEVYLPVYCIEVINPDGSILLSYWNAVSGQRIVLKNASLSTDSPFMEKLSALKPW